MNHKDVPKMSVTAQFDDFCRRFAGDDDEVLSTMLDFVRNQEVCRQRWEAAEKCCNRLAKDNESLVLVNSELQAKLRYTRDVLEKEVQRKLKCEARLEALQAQLDQVRYCIFGQSFENREHHMVRILKNVLSQDNFVSTVADKSVQSVLSPTSTTFSSLAHHSEDLASREVSGDTRHMLLGSVPLPWGPAGPASTGPDPCGSVPSRPGPTPSKHTAAERCSSGLGPAPAKVHFELSGSQKTSTCSGSHETGGRGEVFATTMTVVAGEPGYVATVTSQMEGSISSSNSSHQRFRRSRSGPALLVQHSQKAKEKVASVPRSNPVLEESGLEEESGFVSRLERLGPQKSSTPVPDTFQQQQPHTFISRPAVNPENCTACDKRIRFYKASFQCGACGIVCHPECRSLVPLPCGLRAPPPEAGGASHSTAAKSSPGFLTDYAPSEPPFVPPLVVHCIHEVERRCLQERGRLYGSAAPPEEVDTLLGRLLSGRDVPVLSGHSLPVVCGALMKFLAALRETVITKSVWPLLAEAAVTGDEDKENRAWRLLDATRRLPAANRAVLAKLLVHLRSVSATSLGGDGRSLDELATVFAPVVVGCSENNPPTEVQERDRPLRDLIMHCLLGVSDVYWTDNAAPASSDPNETVQQETRPGTTAGDCCTGGWKEAIKSKLRRSIGVGSLDTGNRK
ncbi:uncharacterized protein LOC142560597 isoform X2 [Dermacentor variabilis]|uniref:uncharacterized protein LOC142560597 isoform X2 n=1 Tax=Dermacentor variabilis TaxID=34621 RepID=UPI003F5C12A2